MRATRLAVALLASSLGVSGCLDTSAGRSAATPRPGEPMIDVELSGDGVPPPILCNGDWVALDGRGREIASGQGLAGTAPPTISPAGVSVDGRAIGRPPVVLQPRRRAVFSVGGKPYRGDVVLDYDARLSVARVLNRLPVEDYLLGVVPGEMPDRFGLEALKAQAVAARSYALSEAADRGYVFADTRSQVYGGRSLESRLASRAVRETSGLVLTTHLRVLKAYYHSTCGGRTTSAGSVFPATPPGVLATGVSCPDCRQSPHYSWLRAFDAARVCAAAELPSNRIDHASIEPSTVPGRPDTITISTPDADVTLGMTTFRERLSAGHPLAEQLPSTLLSVAPAVEEGALVLEGRGWGHGVGLCQYGASGFAARGANFEAILARYYPGAELSPVP